MNEPQLNQKTIMDVTRVIKEGKTLNADIKNKVSKISVEPNPSMMDVADWVNSGLYQLSSELERVKDDSKKTVTHASTTIMKNVGTGLSQYNAKAAEVVNKFPGGVGVKASEYPWVSISLALMAGLMLRGFLLSRRN